MTALLRVKARWTGFSGAPGFTVLHFRDFSGPDGGGTEPDNAQAAAAGERVRAFFQTLNGLLPDSVRIAVEPDVDVVEDTTGELINSLNAGQIATVSGAVPGSFAGPSGAVVNWKTGGIRNGRRIRGRSFIVPLSSSIYSSTGILTTGAQDALQTAASALAASTGTPDLMVYARPSIAGASDGQSSVVTSATVPSMIAVLRSRRD